MAEETPFIVPEENLGEGPSKPDPRNHCSWSRILNKSISFSSKKKEANHTSMPNNDDHPVIEPWHLDLEGLTEGATQETPEDAMLPVKPIKRGRVATDDPDGIPRQKHTDYDMPDGLKVPTNLKTYDGTIDLDDHLTIFMGTMDVRTCMVSLLSHHPKRSNKQRRFQKTGAEILGIRQCSDESLRDYFGLRLGRLFKALIARPPTSMEDLFTQAHNFITADEANMKNRLRDSRCAINDNKSGQSYIEASRRQKDKYIPHPNARPNVRTNVHKPSFTPLIKSPAQIYVTLEGKAALRPPPRMFAPAHRRDRTRYCEFHNDHGHDTNDCIDFRKEIEACIKSGRLSHLAKGTKAQSNNQSPSLSRAQERVKNQIDWKQKIVEPKETNEILMTSTQWPPQHHQPEALPRGTDIAFSFKDPIPEHCNVENVAKPSLQIS
ncbi:retrotransposon gag domain-containing protein [Artemisia annua]|uniref:Retrotransposon gag domain-containing protein n=1 Tax=Artemisia annua TaxID=35608 RepID=A0A2U1LGN6_ARTAN|nr:retrotransposon gag domain-containing protein [Artemisia annua]